MEYDLCLHGVTGSALKFKVTAERVPNQGETIDFFLAYTDFEQLIKKNKKLTDYGEIRSLYDNHSFKHYKVEKVTSEMKSNGENLETKIVSVEASEI